MTKCVQVQLSETTMQYVATLLYVWSEIKLKPLLKALLQYVSRFLCKTIHCNKCVVPSVGEEKETTLRDSDQRVNYVVSFSQDYQQSTHFSG